ncbi:hypothetical protein [Bacillus piscicola]|uniref:hypothetical protein n=1 Tax=Bacillus piscicola TaxID=1632684 RepID=UPI001F08D3E9|nr:hypothetical protein [Bacillus piscicola]
MKVYALSGPSGTGKSSSALLYAHNHHIPAIIDDGLLIYKGKKIAGKSAKYEENYITAIKRATFFYKDHTEEVRSALKELPITRILVLGTSVKMVQLIASKLQLGEIDTYVDINDIRSSAEIKMALFVRRTQGKHIIPIPYVQVEQNFFKKLIAKGNKVFNLKKEVIGETTVVEPNFQMGSIIISPEVLKKIVAAACDTHPAVASHNNIKITLGNLPKVALDIGLYASPGENIKDITVDAQNKIHQDFLQYLNIELYTISIRVAQLTFK